jgi:hypothetical protein
VKRACNLVRRPAHFGTDVITKGLKASGYLLRDAPESRPLPDDVLVIWNRYGLGARYADTYEKAGAKVIVAENGYLGREWRTQRWFALALNRHNGAGTWRIGGPERWDGWNVELAPWRKDGDHILVLPVNPVGSPPVRQPDDWLPKTLELLKRATKRPVRVRKHPGDLPPKVSLERDLEGAWCAATWGSGAGIKAIARGIPVFHGCREWIGALAASTGNDFERPYSPDRLPMFRRLAWSIWSAPEVGSGEAFRWLTTN